MGDDPRGAAARLDAAPTSGGPGLRIAAATMLVVGLAASIALLFTRSDEISIGVGFTTFLVVGTVLTLKRPRLPLGWLFASGALIYLVGDFAASLVQSDGFPGWPGPLWAGAALWVYSWFFWVAVTLLVPLPALLFPTGALLSRPWRIVVAIVLAGAILSAGAGALSGVMCVDYQQTCLEVMAKPLGIPGWYGEDSLIAGLGALLLFAGIGASLASVAVRFRGSRGVERAQMKWFTLGVTAAVLVVISAALSDLLGVQVDILVVYSLGMAALPLSVGVAILRFHLYDIDRIVSRTVAYGLVLVVLLVVFVSISVVPTIALGGEDAPAWLIAASTLTVFALFNPLRVRIQQAVDGRFNRLAYDPEEVAGSLAQALRQETRVPSVVGAWQGTVRTALEPATSSVWLRGTTTDTSRDPRNALGTSAG